MACGGVICLYHEIIVEIYSISGEDYIGSIISMLEVYPGPESNRHGFKGRGILSPIVWLCMCLCTSDLQWLNVKRVQYMCKGT